MAAEWIQLTNSHGWELKMPTSAGGFHRTLRAGVYGGKGNYPNKEGIWYVWRNGDIISEGMALEEAKALAVALSRMGEI